MEKVRVMIVGKTNTGKTTIAHIIKNALQESGFKNVVLTDTEPTENKQPLEKRIEATRQRQVEIEVVSVNRVPMSQAKRLEEAGIWVEGSATSRISSKP